MWTIKLRNQEIAEIRPSRDDLEETLVLIGDSVALMPYCLTRAMIFKVAYLIIHQKQLLVICRIMPYLIWKHVEWKKCNFQEMKTSRSRF